MSMLRTPKKTILNFDKHIELADKTLSVPSYPDNPSKHIVAHMDHLLNSNSITKESFEAVYLDAVLQFTGPNGEMIDPGRIKIHVDVNPPHQAAMVILIEGRKFHFGLLGQPSWRERWRQYDRAALIAKRTMKNLRVYAFHYNEEPKKTTWTPEKNLSWVAKQVPIFAPDGLDDGLSSYDELKLKELFLTIAKT